MAINPFGDVEMPPYFWEATEEVGELEICIASEAYYQGREYAKKASTAARGWCVGDAYLLYSVAERYLTLAGKIALRASGGDTIAALNGAPNLFRDLTAVRIARENSKIAAGNANQPVRELENTPAAKMLKLEETLD